MRRGFREVPRYVLVSGDGRVRGHTEVGVASGKGSASYRWSKPTSSIHGNPETIWGFPVPLGQPSHKLAGENQRLLERVPQSKASAEAQCNQ